MARGREITTTELAEIRSFVKDGCTAAEIGELMGRSKKAVQGIIQRFHLREVAPKPVELPESVKAMLPKEENSVTEPKPAPVIEKEVKPKETTLFDFDPRDIIKHLYNLGYRIENNQLVCVIKKTVNIRDIIKN